MIISSYKSNYDKDFVRVKFDEPIFADDKYYSQPQYYSEEPVVKGQFQQKKKDSIKQKTSDSAKYSAGQLVYVKRYNPKSGKPQICEAEIVSSVDKGYGAISYSWISLNTGKTYRAWEDDIYPSYSTAKAALDAEKILKEVKKENPIPKVVCDNSQDVKSTNDNVHDVSASAETVTAVIATDTSQPIDKIDTAKCDTIVSNSEYTDIEKRVNYLEKELSKEKKKRSKLLRLGIACLFGG